MQNIAELCQRVSSVENMEDLRVVDQALRSRWNALSADKARQVASKFNIGDAVEWDSRKRGQVMSGTIKRFGPKNVMVRTDDGMDWRVHPSFLRKKSA